MSTYDKAEWHYAGNFPSDLPPEAGATHIGLYFAWAAMRGLAGELHTVEGASELKRFLDREISPARYVLEQLDERLWPEDFSDEGNAFAAAYYGENGFYDDLVELSVRLGTASEYHVPDTWESVDRIAPVLDLRFSEWKHRAGS